VKSSRWRPQFSKYVTTRYDPKSSLAIVLNFLWWARRDSPPYGYEKTGPRLSELNAAEPLFFKIVRLPLPSRLLQPLLDSLGDRLAEASLLAAVDLNRSDSEFLARSSSMRMLSLAILSVTGLHRYTKTLLNLCYTDTRVSLLSRTTGSFTRTELLRSVRADVVQLSPNQIDRRA